MHYTIAPDIRGLIFDFDGTLVDSMPIHLKSWQEAFARFGHQFEEDFFYEHAGVSLHQVVQRFNETHALCLDPAEVVAEKDRAHLAHLSSTRIIEPVFDVVRQNFGLLPMGVATGNSRNLTLPLLETLDLRRYFDALVFGDDVTFSKPHPECFLKAASMMNVAPKHCEVFEDGVPGIEGARRAGMKVTDIRNWLL